MALNPFDNGDGLSIMDLASNALLKIAWARISTAVREAGKEILKDPRKLAALLRDAADGLDKYADKQEGKDRG